MPTKVNTTIQINNCETHPLMVNADFEITHEEHGWDIEVRKVYYVELVLADKVGIDITANIRNRREMDLLEASILECTDQILDAYAERREVA